MYRRIAFQFTNLILLFLLIAFRASADGKKVKATKNPCLEATRRLVADGLPEEILQDVPENLDDLGPEIPSMDPAYKRERLGMSGNYASGYPKRGSPGSREHLTRVTQMLAQVFTPLAKRLENRVDQMSAEAIRAELKQLNRTAPILKTPFSGGVAKLPGTSSSKINNTIKGNAARGIEEHDLLTARRKLAPEIGRTQDFLHVDYKPPARKVKAEDQFEPVITPVSEYGIKFSRALLRTTQLLMSMAEQNLRAASAEGFKKNRELLQEQTARGNDVRLASEGDLVAITIMREGILSFNQMLTALLAKKIPGVKRGEDALRAIVFEGASKLGFTTEFTTRIPMGLIGPMSLSGMYFRNALEYKDGKLGLTQPIQDFLAVRRKQSGRGGLCPMALPVDGSGRTGLQMVAEMYWKVFSAIQ